MCNAQFAYKKNKCMQNNKFTFNCIIYERQKKPKEQPRMDNPEKLATLGTQDEDKQTKKHNTKN